MQDYSIAQTSLEQIFNQFAAQQKDDEYAGPICCNDPKCKCEECYECM